MAVDQFNREFIPNKEIVDGFQFINDNFIKKLEEQFEILWIKIHDILTKKPIDIDQAMLEMKQI